MRTKKRRINPGLMQRLNDEPHRFEFFQAVRLLLSHRRNYSGEHETEPLGQTIQFRNSVSLAFPPSEIEAMEFEWQADLQQADATPTNTETIKTTQAFKRVTITPAFIGLTGPMGVLPRHYTQQVAERETFFRDHATRAFLDIFQSRVVALFYQSWLKCRLPLQYEAAGSKKYLPLVLSLAGLNMPGLQRRLAVGGKGISDEALAYYASVLRERPSSMHRFCQVVSDYFQVQCQVEQFVGQWFQLPDQECTRLGEQNCALGQLAFCGARVWDRQSKVRLVIGPLSRQQFDSFLPNGEAAHNLKSLFHLIVGVTFDCEVRLILDRKALCTAHLHTTKKQADLAPARLGWNSWLMSHEVRRDVHDTTYLIEAARHA